MNNIGIEKTAWRIIFCLAFAFGTLQHPAEAQHKSFCTDLSITNNVVYKTVTLQPNDTISLSLDIYRCKQTSQRKHPVIILVHGGGFWEGDKQSDFYRQLAISYAHAGYIAVPVNYRLKKQQAPYTDTILQNCISDVMAAVHWIKSHSKEYGIDTTMMLIAGDSAGGGIVINTSYSQCCFLACIDLWGGLPGKIKWEAPIYHGNIHSATPTCIIHGTADSIIPLETSTQLKKALDEAGIYNELHLLEGVDHYPVQLASSIIQTMLAFSDRIIDQKQKAIQ